MPALPVPGRVARTVGRAAALALVAIVGAAAAYGYLLPLMARLFVRALSGTMSLCLWVAMSISTGVSVWSLLGSLGRAAAGTLVTGEASMVAVGLLVVAGIAGFGLRRLLGSSEEFRP